MCFVSDGDPLSDVGCSPLFHSEAALVEVLGDLGLLLCCHGLCHLPSHTETSRTNNTKVRIWVKPGFLSLCVFLLLLFKIKKKIHIRLSVLSVCI